MKSVESGTRHDEGKSTGCRDSNRGSALSAEPKSCQLGTAGIQAESRRGRYHSTLGLAIILEHLER